MNQPENHHVEVPAEALKQGRDACDAAYHGQGHALDEAFAVGLAVAAPAVRQQAAQQERERIAKALKSRELEQRCEEALDLLGVVPEPAPLDGVVETVLDAALATLNEEDH